MFRHLQSRLRGTATVGPGAPPQRLAAFYWHFAKQPKGWYGAMFVTSLAVALIDTAIPLFIGKLVTMMAHRTGTLRLQPTRRCCSACSA